MSEVAAPSSWWYVRRSPEGITLVPRGAWRLTNISRITQHLPEKNAFNGIHVTIEGGELTELDTSGTMLLFDVVGGGLDETQHVTLKGFKSRHEQIVNLVRERWKVGNQHEKEPRLNAIGRLGRATFGILTGLRNLVSFIGEALSAAWEIVLNPRRIRLKELFAQLELVLVDAIPIICLVTLLIGIVVTYLFAMQLVKYGANIFIVDGVVLSMTRELSPIVVAITLAGRSGSAFTAQIGTMKINQEVDAMITSGLSPMQVLVIPRVLALVIAMPFLVFLGDIVGTLGGLIISHWYVGLPDAAFFDRVQSNFPWKSFYIGLVKSPVFAATIAIIGCQMGLAVEGNARSVGLNTTSTVVQSIVLVIILNALFAVIFSQSGYY